MSEMNWHFEDVWRYREALFDGLLTTLRLNAVVLLVGTAGGCLVAMLRLSPSAPVRALARVYVDLFRSLPLLVLLVWLFFALPMLPGVVGLRLSPFSAAVVGLGLNLSAFVAEIVRAGLKAVPAHHTDAARVAGFTRWQIWRYVTIPIAFRVMIAPLFGQYINQVKLSVLAGIIAVPELLHAVNTITTETFRPLELYTTLAGIFLAVLLPCTWLQGRLESTTLKGVPPRGDEAALDRGLTPGRQSLPELRIPDDVGQWRQLAPGSALIAENVAHSYNGVLTLNHVSLKARAGCITSIIGANGSGKTTLLKCLSRLSLPRSGRVRLTAGGANEGQSVYARAGYVAQEHDPWPHLSVLDNLVVPLMVVGKVDRSRARQIALTWLRAFCLDDRVEARSVELSGGERQRLVLARTLCLRPQIVFLDEPTSAMDFRWALAIHGLLRDLAGRGAVVVAISHGLAFLRDVADEVVFLDRGCILESGKASELIKQPKSLELRAFLEAA